MKPICKKSCYFLSVTVVFFILVGSSTASAAEKYYYQLKIYYIKTTAQADRLDQYLQNAYLPALHRMGIKNIGVFKPVESDTSGKRVYVLIPFRTWGQLENADQKLIADQQYVSDGKDYLNAVYNDAPFARLETIILRAFPKMPEPAVPNITASNADLI